MLEDLLSDTRKILKIYGFGAILFFIGAAFIQWAHASVEPSLQQEIIVFISMIVSGAGFFISITAQCLLIAQRFKNLDK